MNAVTTESPRFSVVVPCYNQGAFLRENLESLAAQTYPVHQIVVVDDGSTDPYTIDRLDELCGNGIELVRQSNQGLPAARNSGIRRTTGDWILPLDCDDLLTPDALAVYCDAIRREPEVAVWYPDTELFGNENRIHRNPDFDAWRMLWLNLIPSSAPFRREIIDAGVLYNETMRGGYEDWEFWIHVCCERGFLAKHIANPSYRYRQWGYSMLSGSVERDTELREQIAHQRSIYADARKLLALKVASSPFLAIATESELLAKAIELQTFGDFRIVDNRGAIRQSNELIAFADTPGRYVMVVVDEARLAEALRRDCWLLEKAARHVLASGSALTWLMAAPASCAGQPVATAGHPVACILKIEHFFSHRSSVSIPTPDAAAGWGPSSALAIDRLPGVVQPRARRFLRSPESLGESAHYFVKGMSRLLHAFVGDDAHQRLIHSRRARGLLYWVNHPTATLPSLSMSASEPLSGITEEKLKAIVTDAPLFAGSLKASTVLVYRAHNQLGRLLTIIERWRTPQAPFYLIHDDFADSVIADELAASVDGIFSLSGWGGPNPIEGLVELCDRLGAKVILFCNAASCFAALPRLRTSNRLRTLIEILFEPGPEMIEVASHYNNLIDQYVVDSAEIAADLKSLYVSPSRIHFGNPNHVGNVSS